MQQQRQQGQVMVSGYLVDGHGQPGGGGLLILEGETCGAALALVGDLSLSGRDLFANAYQTLSTDKRIS